MSTTFAARTQRPTTHRNVGSRRATGGRSQRLSAAEIITLIVIAVLLAAGTCLVRPQAPSPTVTQRVQVRTGDTLWSIAKTHPVAGLTTAQAAEEISRSNGLPNSTLAAGQTLLVPVDGGREPQMASR